MARTKGRQARPKGDKISVGPEERSRIREAREARGWNQEELASRVGVSAATISNLETGRHGQVYQSQYAKVRALLFKDGTAPTNAGEQIRAIVSEIGDLPETDLESVALFVRALRDRYAQPAKQPDDTETRREPAGMDRGRKGPGGGPR